MDVPGSGERRQEAVMGFDAGRFLDPDSVMGFADIFIDLLKRELEFRDRIPEQSTDEEGEAS
jgi:hypothetical protein